MSCHVRCPHIFTVRNICLRSSGCLKLQRCPKGNLELWYYTATPIVPSIIHIHSKRTIPVSRCSCAVCRFRVSTRICTSGNKRSFFTEAWCPSSTCRNYRAYLFPILQQQVTDKFKWLFVGCSIMMYYVCMIRKWPRSFGDLLKADPFMSGERCQQGAAAKSHIAMLAKTCTCTEGWCRSGQLARDRSNFLQLEGVQWRKCDGDQVQHIHVRLQRC